VPDEAAPRPKIDAIRIPRHYPKGLQGDARHRALKAEFAPMLNSTMIYARHMGGTQTFITATANHPLSADGLEWGCAPNYPLTHPKAGQPRYDWTDRGDGVFYGVEKPEDADAAE